ncbi:hypothetical protein OJAV_G00221460 [Oryzias javanicus]|uniref:DnaJ homolog subfamily B member 9 n=1 Tax=Oryzias javanicus TaxID=123683 RepID=A0A3S2LYL0_ORYJA|nr:hypothetical protein OJAV_G00221460 [Oryzias javanicus]
MALRVVVLRLRNAFRQSPLAFVSHQLELLAADRAILRAVLSSLLQEKRVKTTEMAPAQSVFLLAVHVLLISEFILAKRDYYDILGVPKDATERQIKKAFHKLALKYHPDRNKGPDAEAKFREIAEAYETLSDDKRRREYDQFGHSSVQRHQHHFHSHNQAHQKRHFDGHFQSHREAMNKQRRVFQHSGFGLFDDMFEDLEKMFSFNAHASRTENRFQGSAKQHCRTVTQRRGNMVTTFTDCS